MDSLASKEVVDHILSHHGVLGMKWGHRKGPAEATEVSVSTSTHAHRKTQIKTSGGHAHPAHADAIAAKVVQQKLAKSGTHSLSNAEMQTLATRKNLESQIGRHTPESAAVQALKGADKANKFLRTPEGKATVKAAKTGAKAAAGNKHVKRTLATAGTIVAMSRKK